MADKIRVEYDPLGQVATRFANQSETAGQMLQNVRSRFQQLEDGGWIGLGADAFFSEMNSFVLPASQRLQEALDEAGQKTKEIMDKMKQAEEEARSQFQ